MPRVSAIPPELTRTTSVHISAPLCASFIDTDSVPHSCLSGATPSSTESHPMLMSDSDDTETITGKYFKHTRSKKTHRRKQGIGVEIGG